MQTPESLRSQQGVDDKIVSTLAEIDRAMQISSRLGFDSAHIKIRAKSVARVTKSLEKRGFRVWDDFGPEVENGVPFVCLSVEWS